MMSVSTLEQRRALAPAARRQRAVTSVGRKPNDFSWWDKTQLWSYVIAAQRCRWERSMGTEVKDATSKDARRAQERIAAVA
mmetsp:Transcript_1635/g.2340  ORF Transcript_1635/g.2340 Transcript_1635/m.2340 type:complete len:81 (+) Transcript_1635:105-347(+)